MNKSALSFALRNARWFRRWVPRSTEYRLRHAWAKCRPVQHSSIHERVVHACTWKSASQWVRIVLSDPIVYSYSGLLPFVTDSGAELEAALSPDTLFPVRHILSPAYAGYDSVHSAIGESKGRAFFVSRDPRDLLLSRYYSRLSAHPKNPSIERWRAILQNVTYEEGLGLVLDDFEDIFNIMESWVDVKDDSIMLSSFEKLTGDCAVEEWRSLFRFLDIAIPDRAIVKLLDQYSFSVMSGGRAKGEESVTHKYRMGVSGAWREGMPSGVVEKLEERYSSIFEPFGYELVSA